MADLVDILEMAGSILITETREETRLAVAAQSGTGRVMFSGVGDDCPLCASLQGKVFRADSEEARRFTPPLHPNCDDLWVAVGDDQVGAVDWFTKRDEEAFKPLIEQHGTFVTQPDKYEELRVIAGPSGRDFTFRRGKKGERGTVEFHRPRYKLPGLDPEVKITGVAETGPKWQTVGLGDLREPPEVRGVPGHPELLTAADAAAYRARFAETAQPRGIPETQPGPRGHVGSVGKQTWNPAANSLERPLPEPAREWLQQVGFGDDELEQVRRQLWRWSDREYQNPEVQAVMSDYLANAPKFEGRIERHLELPVENGKVDLTKYRGGSLDAGGDLRLERASSFTAGLREPGNVVLVVDDNRSGASIRGFVKPESAFEDEVVVPGGTDYQVLSVQHLEWTRPGSDTTEEMVVVRLRENDATR